MAAWRRVLKGLPAGDPGLPLLSACSRAASVGRRFQHLYTVSQRMPDLTSALAKPKTWRILIGEPDFGEDTQSNAVWGVRQYRTLYIKEEGMSPAGGDCVCGRAVGGAGLDGEVQEGLSEEGQGAPPPSGLDGG